MNFVYPNFLWALSLIAIPIIIHLFYFRRYKKVLFSNISLLTEVKDERSSRNQLKHLLVLLSRILFIIFLVLAFAQPFFNTANKNNSNIKNVSIYIDNSFSMYAESEGQLVFDEAKEHAENIISGLSENDRIQILSNDFEGKHQRLVNKTEAKSFIKDLKLSSAIRSYSTVYERQKNVFKNSEENNIIYQISDYQSNSELFKNDTAIASNIVKLSLSEKRNVFIDSLWFDHSFQLKSASNKMIVRFVNQSNEEVSGNYQLILNEQVKTIGDYSIEKNAYALDTIVFKISETGWNTGKIQISDYPITYDDDYFFSFFVEEKVKVLNIRETEEDNVFDPVFRSIENVNYASSKYTKVDYNNIIQFHFIILDRIKNIPTGLIQSLKTYVENGGNLLVVPNKEMAYETYNVLLSNLNIGSFTGINDTKREVSFLNLKHFVLNDLFEKTPKDIKLPEVSKHYNMRTNANAQEQSIMHFRNNDQFLSSYNFGMGTCYVLTTPLAARYSDFASNALFAPIVYKMAVLGVQNTNLATEINGNTTIVLKDKPKNIEDLIKIKNEELELIPQKTLFGGFLNLKLFDTNVQSGIYSVFTDKKNEETSYESKVALNYSRKESILEYYSLEDLKDRYTEKNINIITGSKNSIIENLKTNQQGNTLWKWFILISLLFLAFEIILLRFLK